METRPPKIFDKVRFHWLHSERSSHPSMAEWYKGMWYPTAEAGPVSPKELWRRGWEWHSLAVFNQVAHHLSPLRRFEEFLESDTMQE